MKGSPCSKRRKLTSGQLLVKRYGLTSRFVKYSRWLTESCAETFICFSEPRRIPSTQWVGDKMLSGAE